MNHCIIGGFGDGDSDEDGGDERRGARAARRGGGSGAGDSPAAGIMGERRPLEPFLHGFMRALPHGDGVHGGGENVALVAANL
jgi:hypothetical protein